MDLKAIIRDIPDFPKPGIMFRDITPVLAHPQGLQAITKGFAEAFADRSIDYVIGIESRGFIIGAPVAQKFGCGFIPVRKPGKLPAAVHQVEYALEYGTDCLEIHQDAIAPGGKVLIIDDVIATGGTAAATGKLVELAGGSLAGYGFMVELLALEGRRSLPDVPIVSLVSY
ncbi:adenine phosphoribosyltransferase [Pseudanabaena sp. PCC 6802]|uniref:adenine phosphoribosyltransferase n=1 Tax=Pseudanabaena sp. PCC 6802 TaxID=118173 RepID=UPI00034DBD98|nr:adenine phosphoribosyltransferase [Pseudanabaena sp. PCC 6802]